MTAVNLAPQPEVQLDSRPAPEPRSPEGAWTGNFVAGAFVTLLLAVGAAVLWPGDAYWMWDEPMLIGQALHYNQIHQLAQHGLTGNFGIPYGPFPTHFYQLLLVFSHDLVKVTFLRALISSATLAGSLLWLARSLRLTPWFAAAMVLGPFLVWTERTLWDATFTIPIGTLAVAAYAAFLRTGSGKALVTAVAGATLVPLIHMQGLPLFVALVGHAAWRHRDALRKNRAGLGVALGVITLLNWWYVVMFVVMLGAKLFGPLAHGYPGREKAGNIPASFFGPLLAGHNLTGENPVVLRAGPPGPAWLAPRAIQVSLILYGFVWLGILGCLTRLAVVWRAGRTRPAAPASPPMDVGKTRDAMTGITLAALGMQMLLAAALRVPGDPQYSFGTFPIHVLLAWAGVEMLRRVWLGLPTVAVYGLSVGYLTIGGAVAVHRQGWPRGILSPTINNQTAIARQLNRYADEAVWTDVPTYARFPRSMRVLRQLIPRPPGAKPARSPHGLLLRYRADLPPTRQVVELVELPAPAWPPPRDVDADSPDLARPELPAGVASGVIQKLDVTPPAPLY